MDFLLGIVAALMETAQIYEYINYDLSPHKMIISDLYEITTEKYQIKLIMKNGSRNLLKSKSKVLRMHMKKQRSP